MDKYKKREGFKNETIIVLPSSVIDEASQNPLVKNLYVTDIGFYPNAQFHYRGREEGCDQNILIYCVKGRGFIEVDGKVYSVDENTAVLIPKGKSHTYGADSSNPWDIYWIHFDGLNAKYYNINSGEISIIHVPIERFSLLFNIFNEIIETLERGPILSNLIYVSQALAHFLGVIFFLNESGHKNNDKSSKYVNEAIAFMQKNILENITLEDLAHFCKLSKSQLTLIFKDKTGCSPIDYFIRLKMQHCCKYIDLTDMKMNEVASMMGYSDPYYFSRAFKKIMGMSPANYRKIKKG
jgi:AraC family transcriptional regulator of arabinose operon